jgi:hypothetical protein
MAEAPPPPPGDGPRGPPELHRFLTISNLEFKLYSPKGCAVELKLPPDRAPYLQWWRDHGTRLILSGHIIRLFGNPEMGKPDEEGNDGLYHLNIYFEWAGNVAPTWDEIDALFDLRPWQRNHSVAGNPRASATYCQKAKSRMPGGEKFSYGEMPPEGTFPGYERRGGKRAGAGRPPQSEEQASKRPKGGWHKKVLELANAGCTFEDLLLNPDVLYEIKPSYQLVQTIHRFKDRPDYRMRPDRKMHIFWMWGASKSGKSHELYDWCERNGRKPYKLKPVDGKFFRWWQRTRGDEDTLIVDDFRGDCWFTELINLFDPTDTLGDVKGLDAVLRFKVILISSPVHPRDVMFYFDSTQKRRKMQDPVNEIAHFMNRFNDGGIYMWTRFPERHCVCHDDRELEFWREFWDLGARGQENSHLKMKTCREFWQPSPKLFDEAQAYGYHPCNPPPPDAPAWNPADPEHQRHQPHIPDWADIVQPKWPQFGPKSPLEIRAEEVENLLRGLVLNDQGVWVAPAPPPPPFFPPRLRPFYEPD